VLGDRAHRRDGRPGADGLEDVPAATARPGWSTATDQLGDSTVERLLDARR
jgi:hypothetical protein